MNPNWAEENLQTIRTLMERSAIYRRALTPIMLFAGIIGFSAAGIGCYCTIMSPTAFVLYWFAVVAVVLAGAFLMVRRQAWRESEPFWSPPTRRIAQAIFPPLFSGCILGIFAIALDVLDNMPTKDSPPTGEWPPSLLFLQLLPVLWVILYGCAVHSAGFFISRGMRIFGIVIVNLGCGALLFTAIHSGEELVHFAYVVMGFFFGVLHLACAAYLAVTEKRKNVA
jgi:hypothetical protein